MATTPQGARVGATGAARAARTAHGLARPIAALWKLRLALGWAALLGTAVFLFGTSWDIQWHSFIGRDRALVPPHLLMLGGIVLTGVAALAAIFVETTWARGNPQVAATSTPFAGLFSGPVGAYIAGFGALASGVGFPLDVYWHALYGIDVSVWAPFHVMIITGMAIAALGAAYMLLSAANLAAASGAAWPARAGRVGAPIAAAVLLCVLMFYLDAAFDDAAFHLGGVTINTFPLMVGLFGGFAFALVVRAWPGRFAATGVAVVFYLVDALVYLVVPPLTDALVAVEHETYRRGHPGYVVMSLLWPFTLIVAAALIDLAAGFARRRGWSGTRADRAILAAAAVGLVLVAALDPLYLGITLDAGNYLTLAAALLIGAAGAWAGGRLGLDTGASLARVER